MTMERVGCCLCGNQNDAPVGIGDDFEYRTSDQVFLAVRCPPAR